MTRAPKMSPWGKPVSCDPLAPGVWWVITSGHGGVKLDPVRNKKIPEAARRRGGWYEEDTAWSIAALVHPEAFPSQDQQRASSVAKNWHPDEYTAITGRAVSLEESHVLRRRAFEQETFEKFVVRSAVGIKGGLVRVFARRASTREEAIFLVDGQEYDARQGDFVIDEDRHPREAACIFEDDECIGHEDSMSKPGFPEPHPYLGRSVIYREVYYDEPMTFAAIVTAVASNGRLTLTVFCTMRGPIVRINVPDDSWSWPSVGRGVDDNT